MAHTLATAGYLDLGARVHFFENLTGKVNSAANWVTSFVAEHSGEVL